MKQYDESRKMWDEEYAKCQLEDLTGEKLEVEPTFDACLSIFASNCKRVLDFGCGSGDVLIQCAEEGTITYGLGIDRSKVGVEYAHKMAEFNHMRELDFMEGDIENLKQMDEECFDGVIVSNVLDVMPEEEEKKAFQELTRVLEPGGLMFVKLNPEYSKEELERYGFTYIGDHMYEEDGILRFRELHTSLWKQEFEKDYTILRYLEFPYPWQDGMNRLFLLRKNG